MKMTIMISSVIVLLALLSIAEGMSLQSSPGVADLRCRCIQTESKRIGRHIERVELFPASSHCRDTEIIATLKQSGHMVCLDPKAPWVIRIIEKILANKQL